MSSPMDDIPVQGGMSTTGNTTKKRDTKVVGYINLSLGGHRVGSVQVETNPFGFATNPVHAALVELFSYDLTSDELKSEVQELINQLGIEFTCQLAGLNKEVTPAVDYAAKFAGRSKRNIKS